MGCPDEEKPVCCVQQKRFGLFAVLGLLRRGVRRDKGLSGMNAAILVGRGGEGASLSLDRSRGILRA